MNVLFEPFTLKGEINAPSSKSVAHRYLIGAALCEGTSVISELELCDDTRATIGCLKALGAEITEEKGRITVSSGDFLKRSAVSADCRESGSTLRFLIPLALCSDKKITFSGSKRLFERPLDAYEELCRDNGFLFEKGELSLTLQGNLKGTEYTLRGDVSSQFVSGLMLALVMLNRDSVINIQPPFVSRPYAELTAEILRQFGADVRFTDPCTVTVKKAALHPVEVKADADYSSASFLEGFNHIGSDIKIKGLNPDSLQADRVYKEYFDLLSEAAPRLDVSDCPDLAPVLIALAALKNGAVLTGTDRLKTKESDRALAMHEELKKMGGGLIFGKDTLTVPPQSLSRSTEPLSSHNDHRIAMALSLILSRVGGEIAGAEAVKKSYPAFFEDIKRLGGKITLQEEV